MRHSRPESVLILGAGPAGLMAGYELARRGCSVRILEGAGRVGGLSGSHGYEAASGMYRFDYGGHRFITANPELLARVEGLLGNDLITAERSSVIRFGGRTYAYPLALGDLLRNAPARLLAGAASDLLRITLRPDPQDASFAAWIESRFGRTLYRTFFEGYTRKLWGIEPSELSADWADQRISLIDLRDVARRLLPARRATPRTYARRYRYPKLGFGLLFERLAEAFVAAGGELCLGTRVTGVDRAGTRIAGVRTSAASLAGTSRGQRSDERGSDERGSGERVWKADHVISTLPMPDLVRMTGGESQLRFRGLRFFHLPMDLPDVSPYTWQYLSDPALLATRLQEPKRRSPFMAPPGRSSLMFEIPCDPGDPIWECTDEQLAPRIFEDLERLGIDSGRATGEFFSRRARCAYPVMDLAYRRERARAIDWLAAFENLTLCGRQGTFRYIFSDTAMEMGWLVARSLLERPGCRPDVLAFRNEPTVIEVESIV